MAATSVMEQDGLDQVHYWGPFVYVDVETATGIIVERRGKFRTAIATGYSIGAKGEMKRLSPTKTEDPPKFFGGWPRIGGLQMIGWTKIDNVRSYKLRWKTARMGESKQDVKFYEKELWRYSLRPQVFYFEVDRAETKAKNESGDGNVPTERIPVTLGIMYTGQITNLFNIAYEATEYWIEKAEEQMKAVVRAFVATKILADLYDMRDAQGKGIKGTEFWEAIRKDDLFKRLSKKWGWTISNLLIKDVTPPPEVQKADQEARIQESEKKAAQQKTTLMWNAMMEDRTGILIADLQTMMANDPAKFEQLYGNTARECSDLIRVQLELNKGARFHIESTGGTSLEGLIGLMRKLGGGALGGGSAGGEKKGKKKINLSRLSDEELDQYALKLSRKNKGLASDDDEDPSEE